MKNRKVIAGIIVCLGLPTLAFAHTKKAHCYGAGQIYDPTLKRCITPKKAAPGTKSGSSADSEGAKRKRQNHGKNGK